MGCDEVTMVTHGFSFATQGVININVKTINPVLLNRVREKS